MIKRARPNWDRLLGGMQLGAFEVLWGVYRWVKAVWIRRSSGRLHFHVQVAELPNDEERQSFHDQIETMVDVAKEFDKESFRSGFTIRYSQRRVPRGVGYRILMSGRVFREIARRRAPSRLAWGR